jgi:hypothetical protein
MTGRICEYTTVVYWPALDWGREADGRAGKRYAGHYAEILDERASLARAASIRQAARKSHMPGH